MWRPTSRLHKITRLTSLPRTRTARLIFDSPSNPTCTTKVHWRLTFKYVIHPSPGTGKRQQDVLIRPLSATCCSLSTYQSCLSCDTLPYTVRRPVQYLSSLRSVGHVEWVSRKLERDSRSVVWIVRDCVLLCTLGCHVQLTMLRVLEIMWSIVSFGIGIKHMFPE